MSHITAFKSVSIKEKDTLIRGAERAGYKVKENDTCFSYQRQDKKYDIVIKEYLKNPWSSTNYDVALNRNEDGTYSVFCDDLMNKGKTEKEVTDMLTFFYNVEQCHEAIKSEFNVEADEEPLKDDNGQTIGKVITGRNITGQGLKFTVKHNEPGYVDREVIGFKGSTCMNAFKNSIFGTQEETTLKSEYWDEGENKPLQEGIVIDTGNGHPFCEGVDYEDDGPCG